MALKVFGVSCLGDFFALFFKKHEENGDFLRDGVLCVDL